MGPAARARRSSRASCAPTPRRSASTARRWSRSTACTTSAPATRCSSRSSRRRSATAAAAPPERALARLHRGCQPDRRRDRGADRAARSAAAAPSNKKTQPARRSRRKRRAPRHHARRPAVVGARGSRVRRCRSRCTPSAAVYVCLIGDRRPQADPRREPAARREHADLPLDRHFVITLGNSSVTMYVDGRARTVPRLEPGDRLLDHQGRAGASRCRRASCRRANERA